MATDDFRVNRVVFIGAGNMAEALVKGMIRQWHLHVRSNFCDRYTA